MNTMNIDTTKLRLKPVAIQLSYLKYLLFKTKKYISTQDTENLISSFEEIFNFLFTFDSSKSPPLFNKTKIIDRFIDLYIEKSILLGLYKDEKVFKLTSFILGNSNSRKDELIFINYLSVCALNLKLKSPSYSNINNIINVLIKSVCTLIFKQEVLLLKNLKKHIYDKLSPQQKIKFHSTIHALLIKQEHFNLKNDYKIFLENLSFLTKEEFLGKIFTIYQTFPFPSLTSGEQEEGEHLFHLMMNQLSKKAATTIATLEFPNLINYIFNLYTINMSSNIRSILIDIIINICQQTKQISSVIDILWNLCTINDQLFYKELQKKVNLTEKLNTLTKNNNKSSINSLNSCNLLEVKEKIVFICSNQPRVTFLDKTLIDYFKYHNIFRTYLV